MNKPKYLLINGLIAALMLGGLPLEVSALYHTPPPADTGQGGRDARAETIQDRIKNFGERLKLRLAAALERADNLGVRVARLVSQFPNLKFDRALVEQKLTEAAEAIAAGRAKVTTIDAEVTKALAATNKTTAFADLRKVVQEVIRSVRTAHQKVVEAIRLIKSAYPTPESGTPPAGTPAPTTTRPTQ
ncbi:MAG: hypothetical protein HY481_01120 [Candidatus Vogelbacteria bacterium]|nr:hypothetical protein [Candidatus Vogelbacteria bacterium]